MKIVLLALLERATLLEGAELTPPSPHCQPCCSLRCTFGHFYILPLSPLSAQDTCTIHGAESDYRQWRLERFVQGQTKDASQASLWPGGKLEKEAEEGW